MGAGHPRGGRVHELMWRALQPYLPPGTQMTYAYRSSQEQLDLIKARAAKAGYKFPKEPTVGDSKSWYAGWKVANRNPNYPIAKPGHSVHETGVAFDLVGPKLKAIEDGIFQAVRMGRVRLGSSRPGFSNPRVEGGCVHVELEQAWLDASEDTDTETA